MTPNCSSIGFETKAAAAPKSAAPAKVGMKLTPASSETKSSKTQAAAPSITYKLSNEAFKSLGWTSLPENAIVVPVVTMKAKFAHDVLSPWFAVEGRSVRTYKNGKTLCVANEDGTGRIYYPNGKLAILVKKGGKAKQITRVIVKTPGGVGRDGIRRPPQLCAIFDSLGFGVVYDCDKKKRMVYDQNQGIAWLKRGGMPVYWKWHGLRYSGSLTFESEDEPGATGSRNRARGKDMSVVAAMRRMGSVADAGGPRSVRTQSRTSLSLTSSVWTSSERRFPEDADEDHFINTARIRPARPIKPVIFQINSHVGVRVLSQSEIALTFFADGRQTRLNIGTLYNPYDKLAVDKVYSSSMSEKVWCPFEVLPVKTRSMEILRQLIRREKCPPCWNFN